jgi:hypothetical protein
MTFVGQKYYVNLNVFYAHVRKKETRNGTTIGQKSICQMASGRKMQNNTLGLDYKNFYGRNY